MGSDRDDKKRVQYTLPDGTTIELTHERIRPPEIMFSPDKIGLEYPGILLAILDMMMM